jgi:sulfide dehydrogenase cytochrome subunit
LRYPLGANKTEEITMNPRAAVAVAAGLAAAAASLASAQQPAPPAPSFAAPNLTEKGVRSMAANCAMCHGTDGRTAAGSSVAPLAGRPAKEIVDAMGAFKGGTRQATIMHQIAKGYSDAEIAAMATHFSKQPR